MGSSLPNNWHQFPNHFTLTSMFVSLMQFRVAYNRNGHRKQDVSITQRSYQAAQSGKGLTDNQIMEQFQTTFYSRVHHTNHKVWNNSKAQNANAIQRYITNDENTGQPLVGYLHTYAGRILRTGYFRCWCKHRTAKCRKCQQEFQPIIRGIKTWALDTQCQTSLHIPKNVEWNC